MRSRSKRQGPGSVELLESRWLLSRALPHAASPRAVPQASPTFVLEGRAPAFAPAALSAALNADPLVLSSPFTPAQVRQAYGMAQINFSGTPGDGSGQTIALVDAYHTPSILSDATAFNTRFSLPQFNVSGGPTLTVLNQHGNASPLPAQPTSGSWDLESSMDVQWAHAMAPQANIVLFESNTSSFSDLLAAVSTAAAYPGVTAVSMSWGSGEWSTESSYDGYFQTPAGHAGVTFLASTGDAGKPGMYPAYSPNVVAVGGTTLTINNDSSYGGESGWNSGGGGVSAYEAQPSYQSGKVNGLSSNRRTIPDVALDANPSSGVYVLDSYSGGANGWYTVGGTSLASPLMAGVIAVANQGRALMGQGSLQGRSQTLPLLYSQPGSNFHDITSGNNGFAAGVGYDLVTGIGSPVGNVLVSSLAGAGSISGQVYQDSNSNSVLDGSEPLIANTTVYLDLNNNGSLDSSEPRQSSSASGAFTFQALMPGTYTVRETAPPGYIATGNAQVTLASGANVANVNLANVASGYTGTAGNDTYRLQLSPDATQYQIFVNGALTYVVNRDLISRLTFNLGAGDDTLSIDDSNGDPTPSGGIIYSGGTSNSGDTLQIIGATADDSFTAAPYQVLHGSGSISYANVQNLLLDRGTFNVSSDQTGMNLSIGAAASAAFATSQHLGQLNLSGTAALASGGGVVLVVNSLSIPAGGSLNLADGALIVPGGNVGTWTGSGYDGITGMIAAGSIRSSLAQSGKTQLGIAAAGDLFGDSGSALWNGQSVNPSDVLVKYTYVGDANLDGRVNIDDYGRIDSNVALNGTVHGWYNGDFNFDGFINIDDYGLIDSIIGVQGPAL